MCKPFSIYSKRSSLFPLPWFLCLNLPTFMFSCFFFLLWRYFCQNRDIIWDTDPMGGWRERHWPLENVQTFLKLVCIVRKRIMKGSSGSPVRKSGASRPTTAPIMQVALLPLGPPSWQTWFMAPCPWAGDGVKGHSRDFPWTCRLRGSRYHFFFFTRV